MEIVRDIKERMCHVAEDFDTEIEAFSYTTEGSKTYELPDGEVITLGSEQIQCPEALFQPHLIGEYPSICIYLFLLKLGIVCRFLCPTNSFLTIHRCTKMRQG